MFFSSYQPIFSLGFTGIIKNNYKLNVYSEFTFLWKSQIHKWSKHSPRCKESQTYFY